MENKRNLSGPNVLLCGLAYTSRTETVEDYFKDKVKSLTVVSLSGCFLKENLSSCRVYEGGMLKQEFKLPNFRIKDYKWYRQPLILLVFLVYWMDICLILIKIRKRYDIYIGISHSFALWGAVLKRIRIVRKLIYYCIDYYIPDSKLNFNTLFVKFINTIDFFTVKNADYVWDLSPKIPEYRQKIGKIAEGSYKNIIVPLGYSRHLRRFKPFEEINRWDIGFIGSVAQNQGLQLLVETLPLVLKELPQLKVVVVGQGPFLDEFKNIVYQKNMEKYFSFLGFIKDEQKALEIISRCAVAVALYSDFIGNKNIICADAGKPKLYALCGLPVIATKYCALSGEINRHRAGIIIDYKIDDLKEAILYLLCNDVRLKEYKMNSFRLGENFISNNIFDNVLEKLNLN